MSNKEIIFNEAYQGKWELIKDKVDIEGWMHTMYFTPKSLGFTEHEIDRMIMIDVWRPTVLGYYFKGKEAAEKDMIRFAEWMADVHVLKFKDLWYGNGDPHTVFTTQQLLDKFREQGKDT